MAYELVEEVLDHAPAMTAAERLILVCIAEKSRVLDRAAKIPGPELARRTGGISRSGIRKALERLAERGLEVRVPIGYDRHGAPFYAVPGKVCHFRVPHFRPAAGDCQCHGCRAADRACFPSSSEEVPQSPLLLAEDVRRDHSPARRDHSPALGGTAVSSGGTTVPPIPSIEIPVPLQDPDSADDALDPAALARAQIRERIARAVRKRAA